MKHLIAVLVLLGTPAVAEETLTLSTGRQIVSGAGINPGTVFRAPSSSGKTTRFVVEKVITMQRRPNHFTVDIVVAPATEAAHD